MSDCSGCSYNELLVEIRKEFPTFKMLWKEDSRLMKFIAGFMRLITFGKQCTFQTKYITTIGCAVYVPDSWRETSDINRMITLRHERVHMRQRRRLTMPLYAFLYLFFPLPGGLAYFRAKFEMEAYEETIRAVVELYADGARLVRNHEARQQMIEAFVGAPYFWMWPFKKRMERWYDTTVTKVLSERKVS